MNNEKECLKKWIEDKLAVAKKECEQTPKENIGNYTMGMVVAFGKVLEFMEKMK